MECIIRETGVTRARVLAIFTTVDVGRRVTVNLKTAKTLGLTIR